MSDPIWRGRVNLSMAKLDELVNIAGVLKELVANHGVQLDVLTSRVNELQDKIKESRKQPKKARSKKHPMGSMRQGEKS